MQICENFDEMVALIVWVLTTYPSLLPSSWDPQGCWFQCIQPHFRQLRRGQNAVEIYGDVQQYSPTKYLKHYYNNTASANAKTTLRAHNS